MKPLSTLAQSVRASTTMAIDTQFKKMRAEGIDVIGFSVGEPDFPTPERIKQAGIRAIEADQTKYTPTPGTLAVRQAVCQRLEEDYLDQQGGTISPNQTSFTVPEGCLFFLGDNRSGSNDARYWEESYIPVGNVKAHVLLAISLTGGSSWQGVRAIG